MLHFLVNPLHATERKVLNARTPESGMTLIEIMIVIAIIAAVLAFAAPRLFNTGASMRSSVRKLAVLTREMRNLARLKNLTVRLVIQMDDEKGHSYWVESATGTVMKLSADQQKNLEALTQLQREDKGAKERFHLDNTFSKGETSLPRGLYFGDVEYGDKKEAIQKGKAYIHFFPQGLSEEAAIHLTDRKTLNWTMTVHPLTGRTEVLERKATLKELRP